MKCLLKDRKGFTKEIETPDFHRIVCVAEWPRFHFLTLKEGWIPEGMDKVKVIQFRAIGRDEFGTVLYEEEQ